MGGVGSTPPSEREFEATQENHHGPQKLRRPSKLSQQTIDDIRAAYIASGISMEHFLVKARGTLKIEHNSVYGAVIALPQIARTSGWSLHYTALAIRAFMFHFANVLLQGFLLFMICKEERVNDKFGGQMHLCDFGAGLPDCPEGANCVGPGGSDFTADRIRGWQAWSLRIFLRDTMLAMFPDRAAEVRKVADPGEYGVESYWLRCICCLLFMLGMWPDLVASVEMITLLWHVPSSAESWIHYDRNSEHHGTHEEIETVKFHVAGMPWNWKMVNFTFVVCPKIYLWILMGELGTLFLMETAGIESMILNSVALNFIMSIDELFYTSIFSDSAHTIVDRVSGFDLYEIESFGSEQAAYERHQELRDWNICNGRLHRLIFSSRLFFLCVATCVFQVGYYVKHCRREEGSWISRDLYLPAGDSMSMVQFLLSPFLKELPTRPEVSWKFPR